jgi:hypothetical protein
LGVAAYGDRNVDGPQWWSHSDLSEDFTSTRNFINKLSVSDGGDYPESVYDAIVNCVDQSKWRPDAKKMILVIGDAPSLEEDSLTQNNKNDVLKVCEAEGIKANIFPVLVTPYSVENFVKANAYIPKFVQKIFPNPSQGQVNIELLKEGDFYVTLMDISGKTYYNRSFNGKSFNFEIPSTVADGLYYLRILSKDNTQIYTEKLQLQR